MCATTDNEFDAHGDRQSALEHHHQNHLYISYSPRWNHHQRNRIRSSERTFGQQEQEQRYAMDRSVESPLVHGQAAAIARWWWWVEEGEMTRQGVAAWRLS